MSYINSHKTIKQIHNQMASKRSHSSSVNTTNGLRAPLKETFISPMQKKRRKRKCWAQPRIIVDELGKAEASDHIWNDIFGKETITYAESECLHVKWEEVSKGFKNKKFDEKNAEKQECVEKN